MNQESIKVGQPYVGRQIKLLRKRSFLSQSDLAKKSGVAQSTLSYIENGAINPNVSTLQKICDGLEISIKDFIGNEHLANDANYGEDITPVLRDEQREGAHIRIDDEHIYKLTPQTQKKLDDLNELLDEFKEFMIGKFLEKEKNQYK